MSNELAALAPTPKDRAAALRVVLAMLNDDTDAVRRTRRTSRRQRDDRSAGVWPLVDVMAGTR